MNAVRSDSVDFFLGTTTPAGFKGYFEPLRREPGMQMYLIKSGPGCGKSTLMKHLAQAAEQQGQRIEKIHCASDPDSLDGSSSSTRNAPSSMPPRPMWWSRTRPGLMSWW